MDIISIAAARKGSSPDVTKAYVDEQDAKKTDKVSSATSGDLAALDASGNLTDSGIPGAAVPSGATAQNKLITESETVILGSASGITVSADDNHSIENISIYGNSIVDNGDIVSVGDSGLTVTNGSATASLSSHLPLCGVPITPGREYDYEHNGTRWRSDILRSDGSVIRKVACVNLADLVWEKSSISSGGTIYFFKATLPGSILLPDTTQTVKNDIVSNLSGYTFSTYKVFKTTDMTYLVRAGTLIVRNDTLAAGTVSDFVATLTGVKLVYVLGSPKTETLAAADKSALASLNVPDSDIALSNSDNAFMSVDYLKDTANGNAAEPLDRYIKGYVDNAAANVGVKSFTYIGKGSTTNIITFPEVPKAVLSIFGEHTYSSNTWSVSSRSFAWGVRTVWVDWIAKTGATNGQQICPATYDGAQITFTGNQADPGASLNAEDSVYTVLYLV